MDRGQSDRGERYDCVLLKAATSMCFFGFFQSGELTVPTASGFDELVHLEWGDVAVDDKIPPASVRIHLKALKCDQLCTVYVGKTGMVVCPVNVMLQYVAVRGPLPDLFFRCEDGAHLTKAFFIPKVRQTLETLGNTMQDTLASETISSRIGGEIVIDWESVVGNYVYSLRQGP